MDAELEAALARGTKFYRNGKELTREEIEQSDAEQQEQIKKLPSLTIGPTISGRIVISKEAWENAPPLRIFENGVEISQAEFARRRADER